MAADEEFFTFSWLALKLLGRNLYSNPWSALSELVANGLDAGARRVCVYLDVRDKQTATIEVFDNGSGMSRADLRTYVRVGYNKREAPDSGDDGPDRQVMGRKGIGKLAALYLSPHFYLRTRRDQSDTAWHLDVRDGEIKDDDRPVLRSVDNLPASANLAVWESFDSGTFLSLQNVDLRGYGAESVAALSARLANQFLLPDDDSGPQVKLFVHTIENSGTPPKFERVKKLIAYKNLAFVATRFRDQFPVPVEFSETGSPTLKIPAPGLKNGIHLHQQVISAFEQKPLMSDKQVEGLKDRLDLESATIDGVRFSLEGWIGVHATIDLDTAKKNDDRFRKNKFYNPAQIRVYVRGKLANDRLLNQLGITGTYVNYVEGELCFDVLDANELQDIATSNRQDFDETDDRVTLLRALVRPVVRSLIQSRNELASEIAELARAEKSRVETASKSAFVSQLEKDLEGFTELSPASRDEIQLVISNKVKGDVVAKDTFRIFISHSRADKAFADLIYELLLSRGVEPQEVFYTSRAGQTEQYGDARALGAIIKENITSANTLIFYLTSKHFQDSEFCMFEGGAGWATRGVSEFLKLNVEYAAVPTFLSNSRPEIELLSSGEISLTSDIHNYLIERLLNPMIEHLNRGRAIEEQAEIIPFAPVTFPTEVELVREGKVRSDYYDTNIVEHWNVHIAPVVEDYVEKYRAASTRHTRNAAH
jgi:hypothetical protein